VSLAVVIVTWNVCDLAIQTLKSLYADLTYSGLSARVVVVDSASSDATVTTITQQFPQVELIASQENLGFGRANNLGLKHLGFGTHASDIPSFVYLLNPDTIVQLGSTQTLLNTLQSLPQAGVVGANLTYGDGSFQHGAFGFPGLRQLWVEFFPSLGRWVEGEFNGRYPHSSYQATQPFPVDFTLGATMFMRREVVETTGMFDEAFFMYCEEVDWAWRIHKAGWQIYCVPNAHVVHLGGQSTGQVKPRSIINLWESRLKLFKKHYPTWKRWLAQRMVIVGMQRKIAQLNSDTPNFTEIQQAYKTVIEKAKTL
jgi:N-acetylglucosaminyl-diphospho-decaprenol L-rhamnosyltransferase